MEVEDWVEKAPFNEEDNSDIWVLKFTMIVAREGGVTAELSEARDMSWEDEVDAVWGEADEAEAVEALEVASDACTEGGTKSKVVKKADSCWICVDRDWWICMTSGSEGEDDEVLALVLCGFALLFAAVEPEEGEEAFGEENFCLKAAT